MKLTLTKVGRYEKNKEGLPYKWPSGDVYVRMAIKCVEYGDRWLGGVATDWNAGWREGSVVEAEVKENGEYLNFNKPNPLVDFAKTIMALSVRVGKLEEEVKELKRIPQERMSPSSSMLRATTMEPTPAQMYEPPTEPPLDFDSSGAPIPDHNLPF